MNQTTKLGSFPNKFNVPKSGASQNELKEILNKKNALKATKQCSKSKEHELNTVIT